MEEAAPAGEEDELEGGSRDRTAGEPSRWTALIDRKECVKRTSNLTLHFLIPISTLEYNGFMHVVQKPLASNCDYHNWDLLSFKTMKHTTFFHGNK